MTGHIDLGALGQIKITVFKNGYKQEDSQQPDYNIVLSEPGRQEEPPIVEEPNDEIPFYSKVTGEQTSETGASPQTA